MIKLILSFSLLSLTTMAFAQSKTVMTCVTEFPTTSYLLYEVEGGFDLQVIHHNGTKFMPIHSGTIVPGDLENLSKKAELLSKMGASFVVKFNTDECKNDGVLYRCYSRRPGQFGELEVKNFGFAMGRLSSDYDGMKWTSIETYFHLTVGNQSITIPMSYPEKYCQNYN